MNSSKFEVSYINIPYNIRQNTAFKFTSYGEYKLKQKLFCQENNLVLTLTGYQFNSEADYTFFVLKYS